MSEFRDEQRILASEEYYDTHQYRGHAVDDGSLARLFGGLELPGVYALDYRDMRIKQVMKGKDPRTRRI